MSNKPSLASVQSLKAQIAQETDADAKVALYEQLVPMLAEPRPSRRDMSPAERADWRAKRKLLRAQGINLRTGLPWTPEELARKEAARAKAAATRANWTAEERAAHEAKLKGRVQSPETKAKLAAANQARRERQLAMEKRLAELEAMVANGGLQAQSDGQNAGKRNRR